MRTSNILPHQFDTRLHQHCGSYSIFFIFLMNSHVHSMPALSRCLKTKKRLGSFGCTAFSFRIVLKYLTKSSNARHCYPCFSHGKHGFPRKPVRIIISVLFRVFRGHNKAYLYLYCQIWRKRKSRVIRLCIRRNRICTQVSF